MKMFLKYLTFLKIFEQGNVAFTPKGAAELFGLFCPVPVLICPEIFDIPCGLQLAILECNSPREKKG